MKNMGKILKIKAGYNPNSSSIGTQVTGFLFGAAAFSIIANMLFAILKVRKAEKTANTESKQETGTPDDKS